METSSLCLNCIYGKNLINKDILCSKRGIVSPNYCCKKHVMDMTKINARKKHNIQGSININ